MDPNSSNQQQNQQEQSPTPSDPKALTFDQMAALLSKVMAPETVDNKHQAHGKTHKEMRELHAQQREGSAKTVKANMKGDIEIKECDKHLIHALVENKQFDPKDGRKLSTPVLQCFDVADFMKMQDSTGKNSENAFRGLSVIIVHDPRKTEAKEDATETLDTTEVKRSADAAPVPINKDTIHTFKKPKLLEVYANMYGKPASGEATMETLRKDILAKLEAVIQEEEV